MAGEGGETGLRIVGGRSSRLSGVRVPEGEETGETGPLLVLPSAASPHHVGHDLLDQLQLLNNIFDDGEDALGFDLCQLTAHVV